MINRFDGNHLEAESGIGFKTRKKLARKEKKTHKIIKK